MPCSMVEVTGIALAVLAAVGLAGQSLSVRLGTEDGSSNDALVVVLLVNVLVLLPLALVVERPGYGLSTYGVLAFVAAGGVGTMLGRAFLFRGIATIGASRAEPIKASMPLYATVIAVLILGERPAPVHLVGIVLIVVGIAVISWESSRTTDDATDLQLGGLGAAMAAAFFFGVEPVFAKIGFGEGVPYLVGLAIKVVAATGGFLGYLAARDSLPTRVDLSGASLGWYLAAGVANTVFLVAYYAALSVAPVAVVVPIMQTSPLVVVLVSLVCLQHLERVNWRLIVASAVVVVGAVVITVSG